MYYSIILTILIYFITVTDNYKYNIDTLKLDSATSNSLFLNDTLINKSYLPPTDINEPMIQNSDNNWFKLSLSEFIELFGIFSSIGIAICLSIHSRKSTLEAIKKEKYLKSSFQLLEILSKYSLLIDELKEYNKAPKDSEGRVKKLRDLSNNNPVFITKQPSIRYLSYIYYNSIFNEILLNEINMIKFHTYIFIKISERNPVNDDIINTIESLNKCIISFIMDSISENKTPNKKSVLDSAAEVSKLDY